MKEEIIGVQALTKPEDLDASAITYASSDKETAEVSDGMIYMYKTGEVTITATSAATDKYAAGTASYKLIISDSRKDAALAVKENPVKVKLGEGVYDLASNITCDNGLNSETFKYTSSDNSYTITDNLINLTRLAQPPSLPNLTVTAHTSLRKYPTPSKWKTHAQLMPPSSSQQRVTTQI